jgi:hypothetical protein
MEQRSGLPYRSPQGAALMPAIFDAPNVRKIPVRDFDAKRVIALHWNEDVADDRLDRVVAFATTHNWASSIGMTRRRHGFHAEIHGGQRPDAPAGGRSLACR